MHAKIAIIGRPNVGKSTLFNRLVGKRLALVDNTPGVTRDRREAEARLGDLAFTLIDTAGLEEAPPESLSGRMMAQTQTGIESADVLLLVIDGRAGITPVDEHFAKHIRAQHKPVILVVNKCEGNIAMGDVAEAYRLGLGEPIMMSAEHGQGLSALYEALSERIEPEPEPKDENDEAQDAMGAIPEEGARETLQVAIVGRPNVGKSTLMNTLLGEDRAITGEQAGITRDAIASEFEYKGEAIRLIDTAGLRKKANIDEKIERLSAGSTIESIRYAHVVILLLDAQLGIEKQDLTIADLVIREGRCLVIGVNKWDVVTHKKAVLEAINDRLEISLPQAKGVPVITLSAQRGDNAHALLDEARRLYEKWNIRIGTGHINRWLEGMLEAHPPPLVRNRRLKIRYITQVAARPPRFAIFTNMAKEFPESYVRYLMNGMRETFDLWGIPLRFLPRQGDNPYNGSD